MTRNKAASQAQRLAKRFNCTVYLIVEAGQFHACSENDLETFYYGAKIIDIFTPDYLGG